MIRIILVTALCASIASAQDLESDFYCIILRIFSHCTNIINIISPFCIDKSGKLVCNYFCAEHKSERSDEYFTSCNSTEVGCPGNTRQCSLEITSTSDKRRLAFRILCDDQVLALGQSMRTKDLTSLFSKTCTISAENNKRLFDIVSNRIAILVD